MLNMLFYAETPEWIWTRTESPATGAFFCLIRFSETVGLIYLAIL